MAKDDLRVELLSALPKTAIVGLVVLLLVSGARQIWDKKTGIGTDHEKRASVPGRVPPARNPASPAYLPMPRGSTSVQSADAPLVTLVDYEHRVAGFGPDEFAQELREIATEPIPGRRRELLKILLTEWGAKDPAAAVSDAAAVIGLADPTVLTLVNAWIAIAPDDACDWLQQMHPGTSPEAYATIAGALMEKGNYDLAGRIAVASPISEGAKNQLFQKLASDWSNHDIASALRWAAKLPSTQGSLNVLSGIAENIATTEDQDVLESVLRSYSSKDRLEAIIAGILRSRTYSDLAQANSLRQRLQAVNTDGSLGAALEVLSRRIEGEKGRGDRLPQ